MVFDEINEWGILIRVTDGAFDKSYEWAYQLSVIVGTSIQVFITFLNVLITLTS